MSDNRKKSKDNSTMLIVLFTAIIMVGVVLLVVSQAKSEESKPRENSVLIGDNPWSKGPEDAKVTLVEFSSFSCSHCLAFAQVVPELEQAFPNDLRFVHRHFPLYGEDSDAFLAAEAAEAAGAQGKYWAYYNILWTNYANYSRDQLISYAVQLSLDVDRFTEDLDNHTYKQNVLDDEQAGRTLRVEGTPALFLNGVKYEGDRDFESMQRAIQDLIFE